MRLRGRAGASRCGGVVAAMGGGGSQESHCEWGPGETGSTSKGYIGQWREWRRSWRGLWVTVRATGTRGGMSSERWY